MAVKNPEEHQAEILKHLPEGSVVSDIGVTRAPEAGISDPFRKERTDEDELAGKVLVKGNTHHGYYYERIIEIPQPTTMDGVWRHWQAHFPDAEKEKFSAEMVTDEEAEKLQKEWLQELRDRDKETRERRAKEFAGGNGGSKSSEKEDYDALTVAELKERSASRNVEARHDWTKDDYVKALKKADKNG
jgi:hypothetical protein